MQIIKDRERNQRARQRLVSGSKGEAREGSGDRGNSHCPNKTNTCRLQQHYLLGCDCILKGTQQELPSLTCPRYTDTVSALHLKRLVQTNGGTVLHYPRKSEVTHIICTSLAASKAKRLLAETGPGCHMEAVHPQVRSGTPQSHDGVVDPRLRRAEATLAYVPVQSA